MARLDPVPGDVPGYGPADAEDSRTLATLLAYDPATQWCITLTSPGGPPDRGRLVTGPVPHHIPPASQRAALAPGQRTHRVPDWLHGLTFATLQTSDCTHPRESRGYQPSRTLRHLIQLRNPVCTGPGCRHPATRCDLDHVIPYDQGGRTCECNLHPPRMR